VTVLNFVVCHDAAHYNKYSVIKYKDKYQRCMYLYKCMYIGPQYKYFAFK